MLRKLGTIGLGLVLACAWTTTAFGQVKLARKVTENSTATTNSQIKVKQILTVLGMELPTDSSTFVISKHSTGPRAADGTLRREDKVETLQVNSTLPGGLKIQFDSGDPNKAADNAALEPVYEALRATLKMPATLVFDKDNKLTAVEYPKDQLDALKDNLKKEFDPEKAKKQHEQEAASLPDGEVKTGQTWERTTHTNLGAGQVFEFVIEHAYAGTVTQDGKTLHKITSKVKSVKYTMEDNPNAQAKITASDLKPTESEGETLFDAEAGRTTKVKFKVRVQGDMTLEVMNQKLPSKLDLTMDTESTVQP